MARLAKREAATLDWVFALRREAANERQIVKDINCLPNLEYDTLVPRVRAVFRRLSTETESSSPRSTLRQAAPGILQDAGLPLPISLDERARTLRVYISDRCRSFLKGAFR